MSQCLDLEMCLVFVLACSLHFHDIEGLNLLTGLFPPRMPKAQMKKRSGKCRFNLDIPWPCYHQLLQWINFISSWKLKSFGFFVLSGKSKSKCKIRRLLHDWPKKNSQHFSKTFQCHLITIIIHHLYHIYAQYE